MMNTAHQRQKSCYDIAKGVEGLRSGPDEVSGPRHGPGQTSEASVNAIRSGY